MVFPDEPTCDFPALDVRDGNVQSGFNTRSDSRKAIGGGDARKPAPFWLRDIAPRPSQTPVVLTVYFEIMLARSQAGMDLGDPRYVR